MAAQHEVLAEVFPGRHPDNAVEAVLDALERRDADKRLVMPFAEGNAPAFGADEPCVNRIAEHVAGALVRHLAQTTLREEGMRFEKAMHVGGVAELAGGKTFESLNDDRGDRLGPHQQLAAVTLHLRISISRTGCEDGVAILKPRPHADVCLLHVVLALIVGDSDAHVLDEVRGRVVAVNHGRRFEDAAHVVDHAPQIAVEVHVPAKAIDVIEHHSVTFGPIASHHFEQRVEAGTTLSAPRQIVGKSPTNFVAPARRVVETDRKLRVQTIARDYLLFRRDAPVDEGKVRLL
nr:hypothetical protein [Methylobacterium trifolii]